MIFSEGTIEKSRQKFARMLGWFYRYNRGENSLEQAEGIEDYNWHVCLNTDSRMFTAFKSLESMYEHIFSGETLCYYEIISGVMPQKIYFDVDIPSDDRQFGLQVLDELLAVIKDKFVVYGVMSPDIMVFSSCGNKKQSYHVVVSNVCVKSNEHNNSFAWQVKRDLVLGNDYVDMLYKSTQQFRIVNNTKYGQTRYKRFMPDMSTVEMKDDREIFEASLVSNVEGCKTLSIPLRERNESDVKYTAKYEDVERRMKMRNISGFECGDITGNLVRLNRVAPSFCKICERIHDSENAFIVVGDKIKLYCFRDDFNDYIDLGVNEEKLKAVEAFEALGVM